MPSCECFVCHLNYNLICSGVHYYLNTTDNTVSWLPPSHPKAVVGKSAAQLRKEMEETQPIDGDVDDTDEPNADRMDVELPFSLQVGITRHFAIETSNEISFFFCFRNETYPFQNHLKNQKHVIWIKYSEQNPNEDTKKKVRKVVWIQWIQLHIPTYPGKIRNTRRKKTKESFTMKIKFYFVDLQRKMVGRTRKRKS